MKKTIGIVFFLLFITISGCSNSNKATITDKEQLATDVNEMGNIINGGYVSQQGTVIYYCNGGYEPIRVLKPNGDSKLVCNYYGGSDINVVNGWIYYIAKSEATGNEIIKIKTDGTSRTRLLNVQCSFLYVKDEWMYYTVVDTGNLFKAKIDGTSITKLSDNNCTFVNVVRDTIYYCNTSDNKRIYKITNNKESKITADSCSFLNVVGDWIYFINESDGKKIYKINTDGNGEISIIDQNIDSVNVSGKWIYYTVLGDDNIHKSQLDGTEKQTLNVNFKTTEPCLAILGNWIYYFSVADGYKICRIMDNGTGKTILNK